jgi:hypothetical protein
VRFAEENVFVPPCGDGMAVHFALLLVSGRKGNRQTAL